MTIADIADKIMLLLKMWLKVRAASVDHSSIIKDIHAESEISTGYFFILTIANLIALSGLLVNSPPVIIGAMLISPLMAPILNVGFSFITGDGFVLNKSARKIGLSVALTIMVAAGATYLSPLKDLTSEVLARTRPNLYDLVIAFLAGTAGAGAICTRKNYLTIVPGVAIATAVIPPLSVTGFGIGTGHFSLAAGGFFLFFTNMVAIIISTCAVFFFYGFRPGAGTDMDLAHLKKRFMFLSGLLVVISIPLIYTLHTSISEVRLKNEIQTALKRSFQRERHSRLSSFTYAKTKERGLEVSAVVNAVEYLSDIQVQGAERELKERTGTDVRLYVEQVKVQPGGLKETKGLPSPLSAGIAASVQPSDMLRASREGVITAVRQSIGRIERILSPARVTDFEAGFREKEQSLHLTLSMQRDSAPAEETVLLVSRMLEEDLRQPVVLKVETLPFAPPLVFQKGEVTLTGPMKGSLSVFKEIYERNQNATFLIESHPEKGPNRTRNAKLAEQRAATVGLLLAGELKIPEAAIKSVVHINKPRPDPIVKVSVR